MPLALVTGAETPLGCAIGERLATRGWEVALHSSVAAGDPAFVHAGLTDEAQLQGLIPRVMAQFGEPVTCLVNVANVFEHDRLEHSERTSWDAHFQTNLRAPVVLTQQMARHVPSPEIDPSNEKQPVGLVINMLDQPVDKLTPEYLTYSLTKAALWAFTQAAAQDLAPKVRVNAIAPAPVVSRERLTAEQFRDLREQVHLGRDSKLSDILSGVEFLMNAPGITGQVLNIGGDIKPANVG